MVVLVSGANGQLGQALQSIAAGYKQIDFHFYSSPNLNIVDADAVRKVFEAVNPDWCINAAAYTAVDKAETDAQTAYAVNATGVRNLAESCKECNTTLIHISTDFVFDGTKKTPYTETDQTNPQGVYAQTKLDGEHILQQINPAFFILRTSWVYSQFGNNFMKTMLKLAAERDQLSVVNDQVGTPTQAKDLAKAIVKIMLSGSKNYGIYHFSNEGMASWYDFAKEIFRVNGIQIELKPIPTSAFPTPAKRPAYSVLDKSKFKAEFEFPIPDWKEALLENK